MGVRLSILQAAVRERLVHDLGPFRGSMGRGLYGIASLLVQQPDRSGRAHGFGLLMRTHSGAFSQSIDRRIIARIRDAIVLERQGHSTALAALDDQVIRTAVARFRSSPTPTRLIGSRMLVVKPARPNERGVLVVDYSYVFPLLAGLFDLPAIIDKYFLVLEPSWSGCCTPDVLLYRRADAPVFVETIEPRDHNLFAQLDTNLRAVPIAANWWVDYRSAPPLTTDHRDIDLIMVAAWASIKRHWRFFRTLAKLRRRGHWLKVALVGYPYDKTRSDIEAEARCFGVADQIEIFERISQNELSRLLLRSKLHVLWSRRECANRAIIEAMLADVPVIVREGLTFGYKYPYINDQTGRFVAEGELDEAILDMLANRRHYAPREWVLQHMTCERATAILEEQIRRSAIKAGENWSEGLVVKTSTLDTQQYWNPDDRTKFDEDYRFLQSAILPHGGS